MADSDKPDNAPETVSENRQRKAKHRAARAARLAQTLRANLGRRKQQARGRDGAPTVTPMAVRAAAARRRLDGLGPPA